ncbi:hypothetical protein LJC63_08635 [Ruminococcaceae bacterium OttesenSCG-928-L11]|nr:hypothetical protein [Ruminococcaceae bacterium OttesenSCG-928-L11]
MAKSPLMAIFLGALLFFAAGFIPYSEAYLAQAAEFTAPFIGPFLYMGFALYLSLIAAVVFGTAPPGKIKMMGFFFLSLIGLTWACPLLQSLLYDASPGIPGRMDAVFSAAFQIGCVLLGMVLFALNYKTAQPPADNDPPQSVAIEYKLRPVMLIVNIVVLPLIYTLLFFVAWYFLYWHNADVRAFYGAAEDGGFIGAIVNVLLNDAWMLTLALAKGLAYTVFTLPMLFLFKAKRVLFLILNVLLYLSGLVRMLIPDPIMPDAIRWPYLICNGALLFVFAVLAGVLLHILVFRKIVTELPPQKPAARTVTPEQAAAIAKARAAKAAAAKGPTAEQAADVVSAVIKGE